MLTQSQTILRYMLTKHDSAEDIRMKFVTEFEINIVEHKE